MPDHPTVHVVVIAVVTDPRGMLLVRTRDDGQWMCPQGWLRPDESVKDTAKRKVSEETGVLVSVERMLGMKSRLASPAVGELWILLKCHPLAGTPRPGIMELDAVFTPLDALPELKDGQRDWIQEALAASELLLE
ncbi:MAG: NUDIX domain-containing protein [Acidobacteriota bacterium]